MLANTEIRFQNIDSKLSEQIANKKVDNTISFKKVNNIEPYPFIDIGFFF